VNHILLLGAGFSRNWGGWLAKDAFDYLLGCAEVQSDSELQNLLWRAQETGGFEYALADIQAAYIRDPSAHERRLHALQIAVERMFQDMNEAYFELINFEFQQDLARTVRTFLLRFDAIFTLNQDLLLDHHYLNANISLGSGGRLNGPQLPGMRPLPTSEVFIPDTWARHIWIPDGTFRVEPRYQPCFKLHGSSNWRAANGSPLLIIGGNKAATIQSHPILRWYAQQFEDYLSRPNMRLMIIGYGFVDSHITEPIMKAVESGLKIFIIDHKGADLAKSLNPTRLPGRIPLQTPLETAFERGLIGSSSRDLSSIFKDDTVEFNKVMRFFRG
jgi:hypothetical protein